MSVWLIEPENPNRGVRPPAGPRALRALCIRSATCIRLEPCRLPLTQLASRPSQEWTASHNAYANGRMEGFVSTPIDPLTTEIVGGVAMGYWQEEDQPFYYSVYRQFPIADRYFCSVLGQTYPGTRTRHRCSTCSTFAAHHSPSRPGWPSHSP